MFARFASDKEAQLLLNKTVGSVPANKEALENAQIKNDPYVSAFAEQFKNSQPMPSNPETSNVWNPMGDAFAEIWNNNKDVKSSLDNAVKQMKDLNNGAVK